MITENFTATVNGQTYDNMSDFIEAIKSIDSRNYTISATSSFVDKPEEAPQKRDEKIAAKYDRTEILPRLDVTWINGEDREDNKVLDNLCNEIYKKHQRFEELLPLYDEHALGEASQSIKNELRYIEKSLDKYQMKRELLFTELNRYDHIIDAITTLNNYVDAIRGELAEKINTPEL